MNDVYATMSTNLNDSTRIFLTMKRHEVHRQLFKTVRELIKTSQILHQVQPSINNTQTADTDYQQNKLAFCSTGPELEN